MPLSKRKNRSMRKLRITRKKKQRGGHITVYPPASIKQYIQHVIYVNLDSRPDRRAQIEKELQIFDKSQIHRIPGIVPEIQDTKHKTLALAKAHLNAIKYARDAGWKNTLFVEDDAIWTNIEKSYPIFERLLKQKYDAIMLGGQRPQYDSQTYRVKQSYGGTAYFLINSHFNVVIQKIEEMISKFNPSTSTYLSVEVDNVVFRELQRDYKWFIVVPALMKQLAGHSDRMSSYQDYTHVQP
jgi:hypothetical protein